MRLGLTEVSMTEMLYCKLPAIAVPVTVRVCVSVLLMSQKAVLLATVMPGLTGWKKQLNNETAGWPSKDARLLMAATAWENPMAKSRV